ncbi:MAG: hypothetical protein PHN74_02930 [Candidatus Pacebacteria bacterium]|nr:hypothetical protein [Candidatus Paceibacterota bacterium]
MFEEEQNNKKIFLIIGAIVAVVVVAGIVWFTVIKKTTPSQSEVEEAEANLKRLPAGDTVDDIARELESVSLGNLDAEIKNIESDLNKL